MVKESELVNQWLWSYHRLSPQWRRVRLGVVPNHEMAREYSVLLRWADAVFIEDGVVNIVEAKLRPMADAIGQLQLYETLFRNTPEFQQYWNHPIKLIFLTTMLDIAVSELCSKLNIAYVIFEPSENYINPKI